MRKADEIVIVGGGVIGLSTAFFLARGGRQVTVLDNSPTRDKASWAGAGILPPGNPALASTPCDWLRAKSAELFPTFSQELLQLTGFDNGFRICGGVEFPGQPDWQWEDSLRDEGIAFELVSESQIPSRFPGIDRGLGPGYFLPAMAQVRNPWHLHALKNGCEKLGVHLRDNCTAFDFQIQGGRITALNSSEGALSADRFLVAGGAWSGKILKTLGFESSVEPIRGQIVLIQADVPLRQIVLAGKNYLVPRGDGLILIGSTEEDVGFLRGTTAEGKSSLLEFARRISPSIAEGKVVDHWSGFRPKSPTRNPLIGRVGDFENLYVATGHFRSGLQMSLGTALLVSQLMTGANTEIPLDSFSLNELPVSEVPLLFQS
ncbi:MAG: FAD-dependent oxidoreductase [Gemmataceae bacterium]|nr:FAD-dependent oxidoreductase [Gemmataceae bacterium]